MANEREAKLKVGIDADAAKKGAEDVKTVVRGMGATVEREAARGAAKIDLLGTASTNASGVSTRAFNSLVSQIQRVTAQYDAVGKSQSDYYVSLARMKGLSEEQTLALTPYLKQLDLAAEATKKGSGAMGNMGISAKQMQASMRGLPAQFTDIFVSLASGQPPMMVFLQQGGQIKDMFGGIGPAAKGVATLLLTLINPFTVTAAAIGALVYAYSQGAKESMAFRSALIDTGNATGTTLFQLQAMAERMSELGTTQHVASAALASFARTGKVAGETLQEFSLAALKFEQAGGQAVEKTAKAFADLANDPLKSTLKLNEGMNFLTVSTYEQIKKLDEAGKTTDAVRLAQEAYADAIEQRTPEMLKNLGYVSRAWNAIKDGTKGALDWMFSLGREAPKIKTLAESIAKAQEAANKPGTSQQANQAILNDLLMQQRALFRNLEITEQTAEGQRQQLEIIRASEEMSKLGLNTISKKQKAEAEINRYLELAKTLKYDQKKIDEDILKIREKYAEKGSKLGDEFAADREVAKEWASFYSKALGLVDQATAKQGELNKAQALMLTYLQSPAYKQAPETWRQMVLQLLYAASATEDATDAQKEWNKVREQTEKDNAKSIAAYEKETEKIEEKVKKLELETAQLGLTKDAQAHLAAQIQENQIVRLQELRLASDVAGANAQELRQIDDRIDALKKLQAAEIAYGEKKVVVEAAKEAEKEWTKTADKIETSLTDALMSGFEAGKSFGKNMRDALVNMFKTLVLRPIIQPIAQGLAGAVGFGSSSSAIASNAFGTGGVGGSGGGFGFPSWATSWGGLGDSAANLASNAGTYLYNAGFESAGSGLIGNAGAIGDTVAEYAPYLAYAKAFYDFTQGKYGSAAGTAIGSIWGPLGAMVGGLIGGWLDKYFGGGGPKVGGSFSTMLNAQGAVTGGTGGTVWEFADQQRLNDQMKGPSQALALGFLSAVRQFGGSGGGVTAAYGFNADPAGTALSDFIGALTYGGTTTRLDLSGKISRDEDEAAKEVGDAVQQLILMGLQNADLETQFAEYFAQFDASELNAEQVSVILNTASAAKTMADATEVLGGAFLQLSGISVEARSNILGLTGGLEGFLAKTATYLDLFYSAEEKAGIQAYSVAKTLTGAGVDITGLDTKEEFRAIVDSLTLSNEIDQQQLAALLEVAPAFAGLVEYMKENSVDLDQLSGGITNALIASDIVAGPGQKEDDVFTVGAPWLEDLKGVWDTGLTSLSTNLDSTLTEVGSKFAQTVVDVGDRVAAVVSDAVARVADRPVNVSVTVAAPAVNGGMLYGDA